MITNISAIDCPVGWFAVFYKRSVPYYRLERVVTFAAVHMLIPPEGRTDPKQQRKWGVHGFVVSRAAGGCLVDAESSDKFTCYVNESEITEETRKGWSTDGKERKAAHNQN